MWGRFLVTKTSRMVAVGLGLLIILIGSILLIRSRRQPQEEVAPEIVLEQSKMMPPASPLPAMTEADKQAIDNVFERVGAELTLLTDVSGGNGLGTAFRATDQGKFYFKVEASGLAPLEKGFFYEGWLVGPDGFFSTGRLAAGEGTGKLYYQVDEDKTNFSGVVITLESEDGNPAPDKHILEGSF